MDDDADPEDDDELKSKLFPVTTPLPPPPPPFPSPASDDDDEDGARNSIKFKGEFVSESVIKTVMRTGPILLNKRTTRQKYFVSFPFQSIGSLIRPT